MRSNDNLSRTLAHQPADDVWRLLPYHSLRRQVLAASSLPEELFNKRLALSLFLGRSPKPLLDQLRSDGLKRYLLPEGERANHCKPDYAADGDHNKGSAPAEGVTILPDLSRYSRCARISSTAKW